MASFRKRGDKWQARVHRKDHSPVVKSFNTKTEAIKWARHTESQLDLGTLAPKAAMPRLDRIVNRYLAEVTPTKKGAAQELNRGRVTCRRCQVISSNGLQCRRGVMKNQAVCHGHSELPKGPRTPEGRQRCAAAKTIHGFETRQARTERALGMRRLRELEDLGHLLGFMVGPKTPGRKSTGW